MHQPRVLTEEQGHISPSPRLSVSSPGRLDFTAGYVWYVSYGSNMCLQRLQYYLSGGQPPDGLLNYPGCRDSSLPTRSMPLFVSGRLYFALDARAWTGGMAFLDPYETGEIPARAYRLSIGQFSDLFAQEMCLIPGEDLDLTPIDAARRLTIGGGCYETIYSLGEFEGLPALTFSAPWRMREVRLNPPSDVYLKYIAAGVAEAHKWTNSEVAHYLISCPGVEGVLSHSQVLDYISGF